MLNITGKKEKIYDMIVLTLYRLWIGSVTITLGVVAATIISIIIKEGILGIVLLTVMAAFIIGYIVLEIGDSMKEEKEERY